MCPPVELSAEDVVDADDLAGVTQLAEELEMNPSSVRNWIAQGRLPAYRDGRRWLVRRRDVVELASSDVWDRASSARLRVRERHADAVAAGSPAPVTDGVRTWDQLDWVAMVDEAFGPWSSASAHHGGRRDR